MQVEMFDTHHKSLDILCIGQSAAGKTHFLKTYTDSSSDHTHFPIFIKKIGQTVVYFHELSEEEELYIGLKYDAVLFFVDLINNWKVEENILKWLEMHSKNTGTNIFKIPLLIIVMKNQEKSASAKKWKSSLQSELSSLLQASQIVYYDPIHPDQNQVAEFVTKIEENVAAGIKCTNYTLWKLYGISEMVKTVVIGFKLTFFRTLEMMHQQTRKYKRD